MNELDTMKRAKMYLDKLSRGIDPISGSALPLDGVLSNVRLSRCFADVSGILEQVIENGGTVGRFRLRTSKKRACACSTNLYP